MQSTNETTIEQLVYYDYNVTLTQTQHRRNGTRFCYEISDGADFGYHSYNDGGDSFNSRINAANGARDFILGLVMAVNTSLLQAAA